MKLNKINDVLDSKGISQFSKQVSCITSDNKILFEYGHKQRFNRRGCQVPLYQRSHHKQGMVEG